MASTSRRCRDITSAPSFLYFSCADITRDGTGICVQRQGSSNQQTRYPRLAAATVLLGPGATITTEALLTLQRQGCTLVWDDGAAPHISNPAELLAAQTRAWANPDQRTAVARRLLEHRFNGAVDTTGKSIAQLHEFDNDRMRQLYHVLGKEHGLRAVNRSYDPRDQAPGTPLNQALTAANTCLYGVVRAAITTLGGSPSLGFLHRDQEAFVYDIADLYKAEITVPISYKVCKQVKPEEAAIQSFHQEAHSSKLGPRIIHDIQYIISPKTSPHKQRQHTSLG